MSLHHHHQQQNFSPTCSYNSEDELINVSCESDNDTEREGMYCAGDSSMSISKWIHASISACDHADAPERENSGIDVLRASVQHKETEAQEQYNATKVQVGQPKEQTIIKEQVQSGMEMDAPTSPIIVPLKHMQLEDMHWDDSSSLTQNNESIQPQNIYNNEFGLIARAENDQEKMQVDTVTASKSPPPQLTLSPLEFSHLLSPPATAYEIEQQPFSKQWSLFKQIKDLPQGSQSKMETVDCCSAVNELNPDLIFGNIYTTNNQFGLIATAENYQEKMQVDTVTETKSPPPQLTLSPLKFPHLLSPPPSAYEMENQPFSEHSKETAECGSNYYRANDPFMGGNRHHRSRNESVALSSSSDEDVMDSESGPT